MDQFDIVLDPKDLARFRRLIRANPVVAAKALTFTAEKAVPAWRAGNSVFHKRNGWIDGGVRMRSATPGNLNAQVGSIDKFMARHIKGLGQEKRSGTGRLFVPVEPAAAQGTHSRIRAMLRAADRTKRKPFELKHNGATFLVRRLTKQRSSLKVLGKLTNTVHIDPRLDAESIVDTVVQREFGTVYERLLIAWAERGSR